MMYKSLVNLNHTALAPFSPSVCRRNNARLSHFLQLDRYRPLPRPPRLPLPLTPPPLVRTAAACLGESSTKSWSRFKLSASMKKRIVFPRTLMLSRCLGFSPLTLSLTALKWVFIATSTPTTVPVTVVLFLSSIVTVSLASFCKNLVSFILPYSIICNSTTKKVVLLKKYTKDVNLLFKFNLQLLFEK